VTVPWLGTFFRDLVTPRIPGPIAEGLASGVPKVGHVRLGTSASIPPFGPIFALLGPKRLRHGTCISTSNAQVEVMP
jgi:hypothetical protein